MAAALVGIFPEQLKQKQGCGVADRFNPLTVNFRPAVVSGA